MKISVILFLIFGVFSLSSCQKSAVTLRSAEPLEIQEKYADAQLILYQKIKLILHDEWFDKDQLVVQGTVKKIKMPEERFGEIIRLEISGKPTNLTDEEKQMFEIFKREMIVYEKKKKEASSATIQKNGMAPKTYFEIDEDYKKSPKLQARVYQLTQEP